MLSLLDTLEKLSFAELSLLALIQGLTEFLPISSSGHLVLAEEALGRGHTPLAIDVALHVGTLAAVCIVYRHSLVELVRQTVTGRFREPAMLVVGTVPVGLAGVLGGDWIEQHTRASSFVAGGLLFTALALSTAELARRKRAEPARDALTWRDVLVVGLFQALAVLPGISRSGTTIATALVLGLRPAAAARLSFLLSVPAILGASVVTALGDDVGAGHAASPAVLVWSVAFAGFVGWGALRALIAFLGRGAFAWFAVYCAALGGGILAFA